MVCAVRFRTLPDAFTAPDPPAQGSSRHHRGPCIVVDDLTEPRSLVRTVGRRERWLEIHLGSTLDRDLRNISDAIEIEEMPRLLRLIAAQAANLLSHRSAAERLGLSPEMVKAYVGLPGQPGWPSRIGRPACRGPATRPVCPRFRSRAGKPRANGERPDLLNRRSARGVRHSPTRDSSWHRSAIHLMPGVSVSP